MLFSCFWLLHFYTELGTDTATFNQAGGFNYASCKQTCDAYHQNETFDPPYPVNQTQYDTLLKHYGGAGKYSFWTNLVIRKDGVIRSRHNVSNETFPIFGLKPNDTSKIHPNMSLVELSHDLTADTPDELAIYFHNKRYIAATQDVKVDKCVCVRGKWFSRGSRDVCG